MLPQKPNEHRETPRREQTVLGATRVTDAGPRGTTPGGNAAEAMSELMREDKESREIILKGATIPPGINAGTVRPADLETAIPGDVIEPVCHKVMQ